MLKNCVSQEKQFFILSYKIFIILVMNYRDFLKDEIQVLVDQIFLRILLSGNSSFSHRYYSLQVVHRFFVNYQILIEFFLNYDCEMNQTNLVEKLFEMLAKISQGKYLKDTLILQPSQELSLRVLAMDSLSSFLKELGKGLEIEGIYQANNNNPNCFSNNNFSNNFNNNFSNNLNSNANNFNNNDEIVDMKDFNTNNEKLVSSESFSEIVFSSTGLGLGDSEPYEKSRAMKQEIKKAIAKFNFKPEQGIKHLISIGFLSSNEYFFKFILYKIYSIVSRL